MSYKASGKAASVAKDGVMFGGVNDGDLLVVSFLEYRGDNNKPHCTLGISNGTLETLDTITGGPTSTCYIRTYVAIAHGATNANITQTTAYVSSFSCSNATYAVL